MQSSQGLQLLPMHISKHTQFKLCVVLMLATTAWVHVHITALMSIDLSDSVLIGRSYILGVHCIIQNPSHDSRFKRYWAQGQQTHTHPNLSCTNVVHHVPHSLPLKCNATNEGNTQHISHSLPPHRRDTSGCQKS